MIKSHMMSEMVPPSSPHKFLFTKKRSLHVFFKQAYGNMSCPRHIGEGQEVQEHQETSGAEIWAKTGIRNSSPLKHYQLEVGS